MQFISLYTPSAAAKTKGPPSPDHMAKMMADITARLASGELLLSGALGMRDHVGARVTLKDGKVTAEDAPQGEHALFAAGGLAILNASNRDEAIAEVKDYIGNMGEGTCEILGFAFPVMAAPGGPAPKMPPMGGVIPYLSLPGAAKASEFYQKAFGAKETARVPTPDGRLMHCHLEINGGSLMLCDTFPERGYDHQPSHSYMMQLILSDADPWWTRAVEAGCTVKLKLERAPWGDRYGQLLDPFGVTWAMNEPAKAA